MSGRTCSVETPYDTSTSTSDSTDTGSSTSTDWYNKYAYFATDAQAKLYEANARAANVLDDRIANFTGAQIEIWQKLGVACPPGLENCSTAKVDQDTRLVSSAYPSNNSLYQHVLGEYGFYLPNGEYVYIADVEDIYVGLNIDGLGNYRTPGQKHLTGFNFMPYSMKLPTKAPLADPNSYAFT